MTLPILLCTMWSTHLFLSFLSQFLIRYTCIEMYMYNTCMQSCLSLTPSLSPSHTQTYSLTHTHTNTHNFLISVMLSTRTWMKTIATDILNSMWLVSRTSTSTSGYFYAASSKGSTWPLCSFLFCLGWLYSIFILMALLGTTSHLGWLHLVHLPSLSIFRYYIMLECIIILQ